ncbi:MAG: CoA transferase [SAR202 cluster bacterium]|nr:CoA transferase [SAR202 cluster bacterium]|tara:strand:- start:768 stop:1988 length:1221 start_codon:yes stop_codon:yes gene_type:complete
MAGPLQGIKIIDLTRILSGPFCTMLMADLGADVIKIEQPNTGDPARGNGPFLSTSAGSDEDEQYSTYFMSINRGKRSIAIDLAKPEGKEILLRLIDSSDVLIENFRPGTIERLGLGYETIKARNPRIIMASISGFGQTGPYAYRPALDVIVQGMGGMLSITGEPGRGPVRPGASIGDITAALFTTIAIESALLERHQSDEGQYIDVSMLDCQVSIMENAFMRYFTLGQIPERIGTRHPSSTPFQAFETSDGHVVVAIMGGSTDQWPLFCAAIDRVDLIDDERYVTGWGRTQNYDELIPIIEDALRQKTTSEWVQILSEMGVPVGPVQNIEQVANDPQVNHRDMFINLDHPHLGSVKFTGNPIKFSRTPAMPHKFPPQLGEDTGEILYSLGFKDNHINLLREKGVIG